MWQKTLNINDLPPGTKKKILVGTKNILIANVDGKIYATQNICTHEQIELSGGGLEEENIICPAHGAMFCLKDGAVKCLPATKNLKTYSTKIENGVIFIQITS